MRSRRPGLVEVLATSGAAAATAWVATLAWRGFTRDPGGYLAPLLLLAVVVALVGAGLRRFHVPGALVLVGQLALGLMVVTTLLTGSPLPVGGAGTELLASLATAVENAQQYRAPVPAEGSVDPLLVVGGWTCMVLVDLCAGTLRRVPLAGLPLLAIYSIPVSLLGGGVAWWVFALTAVGFLFMLYLQHGEAVARWGRSLEGRHGGLDGQSSATRAGAGSVGVAATALAVVAPILVPTLSLGLFGFGPGAGPGDDIAVENPMTDLRRDLLSTEDVPLLRITTREPNPSYLRIAALNRFSDNEWSTGDRDIPVEQRATGTVPQPRIDRAFSRTQYDYTAEALSGFHSRWLPTETLISRIAAPGDWRYDVETLDFLAADEDLDTAGLSYTFTSVDVQLDAEALAASPSSAGEIDSSYRDLPGDLPALVDNLALEVTREHPSRYEKAVALQDWFREDGGFTYSTDNVPTGNGPDELTAFLSEGVTGRTGYCEQFASAMAAMARSLGIPARVAVGFLEPEPVGPQTYEYSSDDMHAWPELYFSGAGWVRFEPTPADRASGVPAYTTQDLPEQPDGQPGDASTQAGGPQPSPGQDPRLDEGTLPDGQSPRADRGFPWGPVLGGTLGGLAVVLLVLLPRVVRRRQAVRRLTGAPEPAWAELEATARDLGVPWPSGRSPRQTRDRLVGCLGSTHPGDDDLARPRRGAEVSPEGVAALDRLVLALERLRYSRGRYAGDAGAVVADTRTVLAALRSGADERARRRARWWPASVLPWQRPAKVEHQPVSVSHGSVVDHVG